MDKKDFERKIERWLRNEVNDVQNLFDDLEEQGENTEYTEGFLDGLRTAWNIVQVCKMEKIKI